MDNYINYSYYDETGKHIAIVHKNIPKETMERYLEKYDEVEVDEKLNLMIDKLEQIIK